MAFIELKGGSFVDGDTIKAARVIDRRPECIDFGPRVCVDFSCARNHVNTIVIKCETLEEAKGIAADIIRQVESA